MSARLLALAARLARSRNGSSAVELALAAPILGAALLGSYDVARGFSDRIDLTAAAARAAELATAPGQVRTDYAFLESEAESAATSSGLAAATAEIDNWLECDGVRQSTGTRVCPAGQPYSRYVEVVVRGNFQPIFGFGFIGADGVPLAGRATVRVQ
jgi:Flp pilus assembly protein TadG